MANIITKIFGSPIFTWWNSATFGTRFFTARKGVLVGTDQSGNQYYREKNGKKRWVIYKNGPVEASRVPAEWHGWLHYTTNNLPSEEGYTPKEWEKPHVPNLTGTVAAYAPKKLDEDYEAWKPE